MNKVALITGASAGMGKETVKQLLQHGYTVYAAARRVEKMEDLRPLGAHILPMDVANDDSMQRGVQHIMREQGRIDVLVNNAGFGQYGTVEDTPMAEAKYQLEVNLFGLARLTQLVLPHMRAQAFGKIVNVTSVGGKMASPLGGWYHASKFAVEGLSDSLRMEVKPFGIDVIVVEPGGVKTEWQDIANESMQRISGHTAYAALTQKAIQYSQSGARERFAEPIVIAKLIHRVIEKRNPKARYAAGYLAAPVLLFRRWLSDRTMDRIIMSQLK